ncbi:hypothetical protein EG329_007945 [Mollisiaceae sp. DMI_Dod_QoI]|nr:hypothetical protein EG329_007945 [Helotiales sp. DMI_Dod_QoI]
MRPRIIGGLIVVFGAAVVEVTITLLLLLEAVVLSVVETDGTTAVVLVGFGANELTLETTLEITLESTELKAVAEAVVVGAFGVTDIEDLGATRVVEDGFDASLVLEVFGTNELAVERTLESTEVTGVGEADVAGAFGVTAVDDLGATRVVEEVNLVLDTTVEAGFDTSLVLEVFGTAELALERMLESTLERKELELVAFGVTTEDADEVRVVAGFGATTDEEDVRVVSGAFGVTTDEAVAETLVVGAFGLRTEETELRIVVAVALGVDRRVEFATGKVTVMAIVFDDEASEDVATVLGVARVDELLERTVDEFEALTEDVLLGWTLEEVGSFGVASVDDELLGSTVNVDVTLIVLVVT